MLKRKAPKIVQMIVIMVVVFVAIAGIGIYMGSRYISNKILQSNKNSAVNIATVIKNNFQITDAEVAYMKSLTFNEMEVDPLNKRLMNLGSGELLNTQIRNIYVLTALKPEEQKYKVDSETADFFGYSEGTPMDGIWLFNGRFDENGEFEAVRRDDIYRYTVLTEEQKQQIKDEKCFSELSADAWGYFVTGYVPIYTVEGHFVGLLGIDMDPDQFQQAAGNMVTVIIGTLLLSILALTCLFLLFYTKYKRISESEYAKKEDKYLRQLAAMSNIDDENLIAKGRYDLSENTTLFYVSKHKNAVSLDDGEPFDLGIESMAAIAVQSDKAALIRETMNRQALLHAFAKGTTEGQIEYQRHMTEDEESWAHVRYSLYEEPSTGHVIAFIYSYDVTERVLEHQIVAKLSGMDSEVIGLLNVSNGRYELKDITGNFDKSKLIPRGDFEKEIKLRLNQMLIPTERDSIPQLFEIPNIVARLNEKEPYYIHYSVVDKENNLCRKRMRFCYLDATKEEILYSRTDITSMYEKEQQQLRQTEDALGVAKKASEAKNEFFSRMSHDMRTPMNGILGLAELAEDEDDPKVLKDNYRKIKASGEYLLGLINDTLDFQKIESGKLTLEPRIVSAAEVRESIVSMIQGSAAAKGVHFHVVREVLDETEFLRIDVMRLRQIVINLLSNAVKFTPAGGTVELGIRTLRKTEHHQYNEITVTDTGIGMSKDFLENGIFNPFSQESNKITSTYAGTGLGLSIAKRLVELMGGIICVESQLGVGTTFTIQLEFERVNESDVKKMLHENEDHNEQTTEKLHGRKILMAEDHPLNAEIARKMLEKVGCQVTWVKDGKKCVENFQDSEIGHYDMILMDIRMPNMTGLEAARAIRKLDRTDARTITILAITANAYDEDVQLSLQAGMNGHISKPLQPHILYETMSKNL